uniref:Protein-lysine N-methyltransferase METTL10 n=1 Tax=Hydra vulgaris TaxID=6087 RepID=T2MC22_HYDVU
MMEEFSSSKLGTESFWDDFYSKELSNFKENKDEGEIWFGHSRMMKVVDWLFNCKQINPLSSVIDIGSGNGAFLLELAQKGFSSLYGIDYSQNAVDLSISIALSQGKVISYKQADFLDQDSIRFSTADESEVSMFDVCHDKGTYDAISLRDDAAEARKKYLNTLSKISKSLFVITSCNWTLEELKTHFKEFFEFVAHIPAPSFQFGGKSGSTVSTAIFCKLSTS